MESRAGRIEAEEAKALDYFWINSTVFIQGQKKTGFNNFHIETVR